MKTEVINAITEELKSITEELKSIIKKLPLRFREKLAQEASQLSNDLDKEAISSKGIFGFFSSSESNEADYRSRLEVIKNTATTFINHEDKHVSFYQEYQRYRSVLNNAKNTKNLNDEDIDLYVGECCRDEEKYNNLLSPQSIETPVDEINNRIRVLNNSLKDLGRKTKILESIASTSKLSDKIDNNDEVNSIVSSIKKLINNVNTDQSQYEIKQIKNNIDYKLKEIEQSETGVRKRIRVIQRDTGSWLDRLKDNAFLGVWKINYDTQELKQKYEQNLGKLSDARQIGEYKNVRADFKIFNKTLSSKVKHIHSQWLTHITSIYKTADEYFRPQESESLKSKLSNLDDINRNIDNYSKFEIWGDSVDAFIKEFDRLSNTNDIFSSLEDRKQELDRSIQLGLDTIKSTKPKPDGILTEKINDIESNYSSLGQMDPHDPVNALDIMTSASALLDELVELKKSTDIEIKGCNEKLESLSSSAQTLDAKIVECGFTDISIIYEEIIEKINTLDNSEINISSLQNEIKYLDEIIIQKQEALNKRCELKEDSLLSSIRNITGNFTDLKINFPTPPVGGSDPLNTFLNSKKYLSTLQRIPFKDKPIFNNIKTDLLNKLDQVDTTNITDTQQQRLLKLREDIESFSILEENIEPQLRYLVDLKTKTQPFTRQMDQAHKKHEQLQRKLSHYHDEYDDFNDYFSDIKARIIQLIDGVNFKSYQWDIAIEQMMEAEDLLDKLEQHTRVIIVIHFSDAYMRLNEIQDRTNDSSSAIHVNKLINNIDVNAFPPIRIRNDVNKFLEDYGI